MLGVDTRSTRDIDTSIKGLPVTKEKVIKVFSEIADMNDPESDINMRITKINDIRVAAADYSGFRVKVQAKIFASEIVTSIDVSTGDVITPREILWHHRTIFNDQNITIMAYNVETILSEKLESMVARIDLNTRLKDYYDLYLFDKVQIQNIDFKTLKSALRTTTKLRGTGMLLPSYISTIQSLRDNQNLKSLWEAYQERNEYARGIEFEATCDAAVDLVRRSEL